MIKNTKIKYLLQSTVIVAGVLIFAAPTSASEINAENILKYVNASREEEGLADLAIDSELSQVANDKLNDMISNQYFAHTSPDGITPWYWFEKNKYDYKYAGENLAISFLTAEAEHKAWMDSPTHRKNIMNPEYQEIGIAVGVGEIDGQMSIIAVQEFGAKIGMENATRNFSTGKNSNLIKNEGTIAPQVLSVKKEAPLQSQAFDDFSNQKNIYLLDVADALAFALLLFALAASPMAFLSIAYEKIISIKKNNEESQNNLPAVI